MQIPLHFLDAQRAHRLQKSAQNCALHRRFCLQSILPYGIINVSKIQAIRWNQDDFSPCGVVVFGDNRKRNDTQRGSSGPRGQGFESPHSDHNGRYGFYSCLLFICISYPLASWLPSPSGFRAAESEWGHKPKAALALPGVRITLF